MRAKILAIALALVLAPAAHAAVQTKDQQKCINGVNKSAGRVAKAYNKNASKCIKDAGKGKVADAQGCATGDPQGKIGKAEAKLDSTEDKSCAGAPPEFGYTGGVTVTATLKMENAAFVSGIFGPDAQAPIVLKVNDKEGAACQAEAIKLTAKAEDSAWKAELRAKKNALKKLGVVSVGELEDAIESGVKADAKTQKALGKIGSGLAKKCGASDLNALFPGDCAGAASTLELATCLEALSQCTFCRALDGVDALAQPSLDSRNEMMDRRVFFAGHEFVHTDASVIRDTAKVVTLQVYNHKVFRPVFYAT